jgi:hypothetical protein
MIEDTSFPRAIRFDVFAKNTRKSTPQRRLQFSKSIARRCGAWARKALTGNYFPVRRLLMSQRRGRRGASDEVNVMDDFSRLAVVFWSSPEEMWAAWIGPAASRGSRPLGMSSADNSPSIGRLLGVLESI